MSPFKICQPLTTNNNKQQKQFIQYTDHHHCCESGLCTGAQRGTRTAHYSSHASETCKLSNQGQGPSGDRTAHLFLSVPVHPPAITSDPHPKLQESKNKIGYYSVFLFVIKLHERQKSTINLSEFKVFCVYPKPDMSFLCSIDPQKLLKHINQSCYRAGWNVPLQ